MSETWVWNDLVSGSLSSTRIQFIADNNLYNRISATVHTIHAMDVTALYYDDERSYESQAGVFEFGKTITFLTKPSGSLLTYLQANATKKDVIGLKNLSSYNQPTSVASMKDVATKQDTINLTTNRALISNSSGKVAVSNVDARELGYLSGVTDNVQIQLDNKVPSTRTINNKSLSSNITLTASDVDAIAAKNGIGTGVTSLEHLTVKEVEIDSNTAKGGALYGNSIINLKSIVAEAGTPSFTLHASGPNNTANKMNMYSDHTTIELSDDSSTRGLIIHAPDSLSGLDEDGMIIDGLAQITPEAAETEYRSTPLTGAFYANVIKPTTLPVVNTTNNLDMLMVLQGTWYTDHGEAGIQNAASLIVNKWPDNVTMVVKSFRRWGKLCLFTVQINVGTQISTNYGFTLLEMPYTSIDRVWINNQTQFYMDANNVAVRVNNEKLLTGTYTLTGFYLTTDNARVVS